MRSEKLDEILTEACRLVGEALGTDLAKVVELQEDGQTLLVRAGVGWKPGVIGQVRLKAAQYTPEGRAIQAGEPVISPDISKETRFTYPAFLVENGVRAIANVLIIAGQNKPPFGLLQIDSREPRRFTEDDIAFLRSYANLLAAAVDRLRVISEVRDGNDILEARVAERTRELTEANAKLQAEAAERERVEGALLNLVINARDAMPESGHLLIETRTEIVPDRRRAPGVASSDYLPAGEYVVLAVIDTGVGMTANEVARAFEPFLGSCSFDRCLATIDAQNCCDGDTSRFSIVYSRGRRDNGGEISDSAENTPDRAHVQSKPPISASSSHPFLCQS